MLSHARCCILEVNYWAHRGSADKNSWETQRSLNASPSTLIMIKDSVWIHLTGRFKIQTHTESHSRPLNFLRTIFNNSTRSFLAKFFYVWIWIQMIVDLINVIVLIIIWCWSACVARRFFMVFFKHEQLWRSVTRERRKITLPLLRPLKSPSFEIKEMIRAGYFHFHEIPILRESFVSEKLIKSH